MANLNEICIFTGRLGQDARMGTTNTGTNVVNFTIAVDRSYTDQQGQRVSNTFWLPVAIWGGSEAQAKALTKGTLVSVDGRLSLDKPYTTRDGEVRSQMKLDCSRAGMKILASPMGQAQAQQPQEVPADIAAQMSGGEESGPDGDLPF